MPEVAAVEVVGRFKTADDVVQVELKVKGNMNIVAENKIDAKAMHRNVNNYKE